MHTVLITGATGYIGSVVAGKLATHGAAVTGLARSERAAEELRAAGHQVLAGDLEDVEALEAAARRHDAVVHAGATGRPGQDRVDLAATRALLRGIGADGRVFVYTSGAYVLGDTGDLVADEDWPARPPELVAWRLPLEQEILQNAAAGMRAAVIRPALVYGRAGGTLRQLVEQTRKRGAPRVVGTGVQRWPTVHVEDLAELYIRVLTASSAGGIFHGSSGDYAAGDLALAAAIAGGGDRFEPWPLSEARERLGAYADALALSQRLSSRRAHRVLGWLPAAPSALQELLTGSYRD